MKNFRIVFAVFSALLLTATLALAGDFDFLRELDKQAREDIRDFEDHLSKTFGVPVPHAEDVIKRIGSPADAFMALHVAMLSQKPVQVVIEEYHKNKGKGWGVIARNMGIKPGSKEFHKLKERHHYKSKGKKGKDDDDDHGRGGKNDDKGKGRGKGHK